MMVYASKSLGYEYVAITDHSERAWSSRKLSTRGRRPSARGDRSGAAAPAGHRGPARRRSRHHEGRHRSTFPTTLLEGFDIVLASLHDHGGQSGDELTDRLSAGHRSSARQRHHAPRQPLAGGVDRATTSTSIGCSRPRRRPARRSRSTARPATSTWTAAWRDARPPPASRSPSTATATGRKRLSRQMRFGVGTARRGWVEPHHVLTRGRWTMSAPSSRPNVRGDRVALAAIVATWRSSRFSRTLLPGVDLGRHRRASRRR